MPTLEINLQKIQHNAKILKNLLNKQKISLVAVVKVVQGNPVIARSLIQAGIKYLGDSRITNIIKMKKANIDAKFMLIRVPSITEIPLVVKYADYSLNSELKIIKLLSNEAIKQRKIHNIILMLDMGDLREGINPSKIEWYVKEILSLKNIKLSGIGMNVKCFQGIIPTDDLMSEFSNYAYTIEKKFGLDLNFVSGGNSANYNWLMTCKNPGAINNLRMGESLFLGKETINFKEIPNLFIDAFKLSAEIIEIKERSTFIRGPVISNAFGEKIQKTQLFNEDNLEKNKTRTQALLNIGREDVAINGITPIEDIKILGGSSDYLVIDVKNNIFHIGDKLNFDINYEALLRLMASSHIHKKFI
ncbi:MAG: alanine/ornithine racemase family PLP-dependent enzyme [Promethearchaeota archaeon]